MGINTYNFIVDVEYYLSDFISANQFKVYNDFDSDLSQAVFLENEKIKIWLTTLESFPYQAITFKFYLNNTIIEAEEFLEFWGLSIKEYDKIYLEITKSIPYPTGSEFKGYQKDLLVVKTLVSKFYLPMTIL